MVYIDNCKKIMFIGLFCLLVVNSCNAQHRQSESCFWECWHPVNYIYLENYALSKSEINAILKKRICIEKNHLEVFGNSVGSTTYTINNYEAKSYIKENLNLSKSKIGIKSDTLSEIVVTGNDSSGKKAEVILLYDQKRLYYTLDGVLFILSCEKTMNATRSSR